MSTGKTGTRYDEDFKRTLVNLYHSLQEMQLSVFEYIEGYYNSRKPHSSLGMLTSNEKEELFWIQT